MEKRPFSELGLSAEVLKAVDKLGFEEASPIQTAVIPPLLEGRDVVGQSATGSGKTAAFAIPAIELVDPKLKRVQVLILCPTRELAMQVAEDVNKLAAFKRGVMEVPIYGGQPYDRQIRALRAGAQIVIGTPGRVMDHMERGTMRLDDLKMVILDECDRMLDMGFRDDIDTVMSGTPAGRQSLFFSATLPPAIRTLIKRYTNNPAEIKIQALAQNAPQVEQMYFEVQRRAKVEALTRLIDRFDFRHGIVFCSTKIMVDELDELLHARGYATDRLHGDITQAQRTRVTEKFKRKGFEFLIATDVAARGLDVHDLEVVFNFDLPNDAEDYTHRIGRTGRAGKSGKAFTFVSNREIYKLQSMIRYGKLKIQRGQIPSIDEIEEAKENKFFEKLRTTLESGEFVKQERMIDRLLEQGHASTDIVSALIHMMHSGPVEPAKAPPPPPKPKPEPRSYREDRGPREDRGRPGPSQGHDDRGPPGDRHEKPQQDRPGRTGREDGFVTIFFNIGRKQMITPSDLVGKIAGVTRQPGSIVGAIDLKQRHSLVDVSAKHADDVLQKMAGVRVKGVTLQPVPAAQMS
ncbi:MAG: DEAD/DEAH box helicase [Opitutaceae bacterium]